MDDLWVCAHQIFIAHPYTPSTLCDLWNFRNCLERHGPVPRLFCIIFRKIGRRGYSGKTRLFSLRSSNVEFRSLGENTFLTGTSVVAFLGASFLTGATITAGCIFVKKLCVQTIVDHKIWKPSSVWVSTSTE